VIDHLEGSNTLYVNDSNVGQYTLTISNGDTISLTTNQLNEPGCSGTQTGSLKITDSNNMSGSVTKTCNYSGGSCSFTMSLHATKAGGGGGGGSDGGGCVMNPQAKMDLSLVILFMLSIYRISRIYWRKSIHRA
jgi:hypothetical protein